MPISLGLSDSERSLWLELIQRRTGLTFTTARIRLLEAAIAERLEALRLTSASDYWLLINHSPAGSNEWPELLERLVIHESSFFRNKAYFDFLKTHLLPELLPTRVKLTLWSAGCSLGQEAYSLAMTCLEAVPHARHRVRVIGTDISDYSLNRASKGIYSPAELRRLEPTCLAKYFTLAENGHYQLSESVRELVTFRWFNLMQPESYPAGPFEVIFCQNVLIYFETENRLRAIESLARHVSLGGGLFLGAVESAGVRLSGFVPTVHEDAIILRRER